MAAVDRSGWAVITATFSPAATSRATAAAPMNPLPPATRITEVAPELRRPSPSGHQAVGEGLRVERDQIVRTLAHPDQLDRDAQLLPRGQDDPSTGRAVQLGEDHAGHVHGF